MTKNPLPRRYDAAPDFSTFRKVLLRQKDAAFVPIYELFANREIIEPFTESEDAGTGDWKFYLWAGYDYAPIGAGVNLPLGNLVDTSKPYPIKNWTDLKAYPWPTEFSFDHFNAVWREMPSEMRIIGQMSGTFEMAESLLGYQTLCYFLYDEPDLMAELFARIGDLFTRLYTQMAEQAGVGALVISDDMGYKCGTMISADHLRQYVKPVHAKLAKIAHDAGLPCILHSCGNLEEIMDEWIDEVKIDAKHSFEDEIMPVEQVYAKYGKRLTILGGYDMNRLCRETPEQIYENCIKLMEMGKGGGYALGSGNSIAAFVPLDNYCAMLQANKDFR